MRFLFHISYDYPHNVLVDKIVIAQQSLQEFINVLSPGAYSGILRRMAE